MPDKVDSMFLYPDRLSSHESNLIKRIRQQEMSCLLIVEVSDKGEPIAWHVIESKRENSTSSN